MFIIEEMKKIIRERNIKKLGIFVDMDGVIADYRFGEGDKIKNNDKNVYLNKRPIKTTINILKNINEQVNCKMHILSSCLFEEQKNEKIEWIGKNVNFVATENIDIVIAKDFEHRKELKVDKILQIMKMNEYDYAFLIDDTHEILFLAMKKSNGNIIPFHIVTILD